MSGLSARLLFRAMGETKDDGGQRRDPEDELRERLVRRAGNGIRQTDLAQVLESAVDGTRWRVAGKRLVRSAEIAPTYEVVVLHDPTLHPALGGPLWAVLAFPVIQPFAEMTSEQRADRPESLFLEVGTSDQLVPWLMPPDLAFLHLPLEHPIHSGPRDDGPALWEGHPLYGWNRLRELAALVVLLETVRATEPEQADALERLIARHPQAPVVSEYRRAVSAAR